MATHRVNVAHTLFLPGAGGRLAFWQPVASRLVHAGAPRFFPYPSCGDVEPDPSIHSLDDLYAWFVARAPAEPSHVVAQSMGCVLAMRFAIEHPSRVGKLVLVAASGGTRVRFGRDWRVPDPAEAPSAPSIPMWFVNDRTELDERLGAITASTLLIFGDADPISPPAWGEYLEARIPRSRLAVIRGGTHSLAIERADEVARLIDEHVGAREL